MDKVFVSRQLPGAALQRLGRATNMHCWPGDAPPDRDSLLAAVADCRGLLCTLNERIDSQLLQAAPQLAVVSSCSVGVDHVDLAALNSRGVILGHTPHVLTDATADLAFALLLAAARRLPEGERHVRSGAWAAQPGWDPSLLLGTDLRGRTLGLLGLGPIGQAMARRAQGFGLRIVGWTPSGRAVDGVEAADFDGVLEQADFLSLHLALTPQTRHIIDARALARLRPHAILINSARGGLVDEAALAAALQAGRLGGAALDVFEQEPIASTHALLQLPGVVVAPHLGSATRGTREAMAELAVDNLLAGLRGEPLPAAYPLPTRKDA